MAEGILYKTGQIRKVGRVDHKDAFLDTEELEKARGITIFSKQAVQQFLKRCGIFFDHIGPEIRPQQRESSQSSSERASTVPKPCVTAMSSSVRPAFASSISSDAPSIFPACSASVRSDQELRLSIPFVIVFCYHGCKCKTGERPLFCLAVLRFCRFTE